MFADACEKAMGYTFPIVISARYVGGNIDSTVGTAVMVNADGWFITAAHYFESSRKYNEDMAKMKKLEEDRKNGTAAPDAEYDPKWISQHSIWCGRDTARLSEVQIFPELDIAVGRLTGHQNMTRRFAVFKEPSRVRIGASLCRLGYPMNVGKIADYDESKSAFLMKKGTQFAAFSNEGMHTRNVYNGEDRNGIKKLFLEMSSPGLAGQSGGPVIDRSGSVAAMHVGNVSLPLNVSPVMANGEKMPDRQYINVGLGVHVESIIKILEMKKIRYDSENGGGEYRIVS